ncbi:lycopene beta-cyclase CrtY [Sphingomonas sp. RP10(2022)]|uniref:Lycopene beta-cyclase CrtY n=1 Tax=Sphingomonas liriopis TaxID=2949094 RepID=A0A9X2HUC2_9SPHN|nr:lycopene beta-cyclase CrtY [Sphingomonas liriopis]MCP3736042.1 lycopene beta-cyclase CrtY [Sphingomonas liriopis]
MGTTIPCDLAIVGGGLAGGLIALALKAKRPDLDIRIVEAGASLGGDHVWSFFGSDVVEGDRWLVAPLVVHGWRGYDVAFPHLSRDVDATYYSLTSERFDAVVRGALPADAVMLGRKVLAASATAVVLADGDRVEAKGVIDARGPGDLSTLDLGWQKFVGQELALAAPHGIDRPRVMDATVEQIDGYRFIYCLPFGERRMFVEDTYYSDTPDLDGAAIGVRIADYARARGWDVTGVVRGEAGVLPITLGGDFDAYWRSTGGGIAKAGMRAGLFQPATGYSLPDAVRLAVRLAAESDLSGAALARFTHDYARAAWKRGAFYRMLGAMMFRAGEPAERWRIIERFYRLDPMLITRFYAGRSSLKDKARILTGKPPVPVGRAIRVLRTTAWR